MVFEETGVFNIRNAIRGMRNPLNSWDKSDSIGDKIGENDIALAQKLIRGGTEHRKFLRQIFVSVDITAPLYWWKEMDTYKLGTVANSTSTMHKLASTPITVDCFEVGENSFEYSFPNEIISYCEFLRQKYNETKDKDVWYELIRWLPESWLQKRTWTANYEVLRNIIHQRSNHKLVEWHKFIEWCKCLPYANELLFYKGEN